MKVVHLILFVIVTWCAGADTTCQICSDSTTDTTGMQSWIQTFKDAEDAFKPANWTKQQYDRKDVDLSGQVSSLVREFVNICRVPVERRSWRMKAFLSNNGMENKECEKICSHVLKKREIPDAKLIIYKVENSSPSQYKVFLGGNQHFLTVNIVAERLAIAFDDQFKNCINWMIQ